MAYIKNHRGSQVTTVYSGGKIPNGEPPDDPWYKRPIGLILIGVLVGLIVGGVVYWLGWN